MVNKSKATKRGIKVNGQKLEVVNSFKYMGAIVTDEESRPEILSRRVQTLAASARLRLIWRAE